MSAVGATVHEYGSGLRGTPFGTAMGVAVAYWFHALRITSRLATHPNADGW
jgi:hypothetical protein